ncbi:hypothetical protein [Vibrio mexicanus]|uniref:hypothetical protein n=1 Tax=Vibrio mexicanus TaxID=1004326 RepID=UPI00063C0C33|nr:hypothetical protein [Vibrio mexicanus]
MPIANDSQKATLSDGCSIYTYTRLAAVHQRGINSKMETSSLDNHAVFTHFAERVQEEFVY